MTALDKQAREFREELQTKEFGSPEPHDFGFWDDSRVAAFATQVREQTVAEKWVSVAERLPEDTRNVLLVCLEGVRVGWCRDKDTRPVQWRVAGYSDNIEVTHWQPLPAPPETTEQEER